MTVGMSQAKNIGHSEGEAENPNGVSALLDFRRRRGSDLRAGLDPWESVSFYALPVGEGGPQDRVRDRTEDMRRTGVSRTLIRLLRRHLPPRGRLTGTASLPPLLGDADCRGPGPSQ